MQKTLKPRTKVLIAVASLLALAAIFFTAYQLLQTKGQEGAKTVHVNVIVDEETVKELDINTDAAYLRGALEEKDLIQGEESTYGLMVKTVNGRTADEAKQEWWQFTKSGEFLNTGVDDTPIENGDAFEITLVVGW